MHHRRSQKSRYVNEPTWFRYETIRTTTFLLRCVHMMILVFHSSSLRLIDSQILEAHLRVLGGLCVEQFYFCNTATPRTKRSTNCVAFFGGNKNTQARFKVLAAMKVKPFFATRFGAGSRTITTCLISAIKLRERKQIAMNFREARQIFNSNQFVQLSIGRSFRSKSNKLCLCAQIKTVSERLNLSCFTAFISFSAYL